MHFIEYGNKCEFKAKFLNNKFIKSTVFKNEVIYMENKLSEHSSWNKLSIKFSLFHFYL